MFYNERSARQDRLQHNVHPCLTDKRVSLCSLTDNQTAPLGRISQRGGTLILHHTAPLGVCLYPLRHQQPSLAETSHGTLSAATSHFKETWKSTHISLRSYVTTDLFDVTLPHHHHRSWRRENIFFCQGWCSRPLSGKAAAKQQQNSSNKSPFANDLCMSPVTSVID